MDDRAFLLNSGTGATYVEDGDDMRLVNSTEIFPGDRVRFADGSGCPIRSTGFVRLERNGDSDTLQVISSARMAGAVLSVERVATSGEDGNGRQKYINFGANFLDKILTHWLIVWLGAAITSLVICVELYSLTSEYLSTNGPPMRLDTDPPVSQEKASSLVTSGSKPSLRPRRAKKWR